MVRKKQKIQSMLLGILFLALIGTIFIITYKKLNPGEEEGGFGFDRFQEWMDIKDVSKVEYMEIVVENKEGQEEREEQSYIIREEENMKKIWEALEDSTFRVVNEAGENERETENGVFWEIDMHQKDRCAEFYGQRLKNKCQYFNFAVAKPNGIDLFKDGEYLYQHFTFDTDIEEVLQEVVEDEIEVLDLEELERISKDGLDIRELKHYYYTGGIKMDGIIPGSGDLVEFQLKEEGYRLIVNYLYLVDVDGTLDDSVILARLYHPDGTYEKLVEEV